MKFLRLLDMFLRNSFSYLIIAFSLCLFAGCEVFNPTEDIPSYIHIDKINLTTTSDQGSSSNKITDAWVYVDDKLIGAFELPATFPVISSGKHLVTIKPGIKVNGISATRAIYPFYTNYSEYKVLVPDSVITINPTLTYNSYTVFEWKEAFEDGGITLQQTIHSDTSIYQTSDTAKVFEGVYSGVINLDANHGYCQIETTGLFTDLPTGDSPVFLEINYKTNEVIKVGLIANYSSQLQKLDILYLNKSTTWNKIYINLKTAVNTASNPLNFQVYLEAYKSSENATAELLFDNFKLVHN